MCIEIVRNTLVALKRGCIPNNEIISFLIFFCSSSSLEDAKIE